MEGRPKVGEIVARPALKANGLARGELALLHPGHQVPRALVCGGNLGKPGKLRDITHIKCLTKLEWLNLDFNSITHIEDLLELTALKTLTLYSNDISTVSGLKKLVKLRVLDLSGNNLHGQKFDVLEKLYEDQDVIES